MNTRTSASLLLAGMLLTNGHIAAQPPSVVLTHANVIDGTGAPIRRDMTVTISEGRISTIEPSDRARVPPGAQVVDASGKYLIPGLWDMHVHWYDERFLSLFVANGVTGVRQMWGMPLHLGWRNRVATGVEANAGPFRYQWTLKLDRSPFPERLKLPFESPLVYYGHKDERPA